MEHPIRILVVDDDADTCQNLSDILSEFGYLVDTATDGPSALEKVRQHAYDIALLDLKMPGMDGLALYREIKRWRAGTVAIIVTAYATPDTERQAMEAGAWKMVPKPIDFPKLMELVDAAVDQPLVMVVDDDRDLCASLWDLLRERDYRVCLAHDFEEARYRLEGRPFRVVLVDMKLPGGDGREVYRVVRETCPQARTILITGHRSEMEGLVARVLEEGADAVCYKPFDVEMLLDHIQRLVLLKNR